MVSYLGSQTFWEEYECARDERADACMDALAHALSAGQINLSPPCGNLLAELYAYRTTVPVCPRSLQNNG